jgi:hypothetical protein
MTSWQQLCHEEAQVTCSTTKVNDDVARLCNFQNLICEAFQLRLFLLQTTFWQFADLKKLADKVIINGVLMWVAGSATNIDVECLQFLKSRVDICLSCKYFPVLALVPGQFTLEKTKVFSVAGNFWNLARENHGR